MLIDISNSLDLSLSKSNNQVSTRYLDNTQDMNSVINLIFLRLNFSEFDYYTIYPEFCCLSNYTLLIVDISIIEKFIPNKCTIIKNSEEDKFITDLIKAIKKINTKQISNQESLKLAIQEFTNKSDVIWYKYSKYVNITKYSKAW